MVHVATANLLHLVGLAIPACLFPSSPRPSCTADSRADLRDTAVLPRHAAAFPSPSPPCHFLCTFHISSLAFLPHLQLPPQIPKCFPDCVVPILEHVLHGHGVCVPSTFPFAFLGVLLESPHSKEPTRTPIRHFKLFLYMSLVHHPKTHQKHVRTTESTQYLGWQAV
jgi:hypothetical protein